MTALQQLCAKLGAGAPAAVREAIIARMQHLQPINHKGQVAAVVIGDLALIDDTLPDDAHRHVQAMCLYALEIADRERPGPYTDADATAYADAATARA